MSNPKIAYLCPLLVTFILGCNRTSTPKQKSIAQAPKAVNLPTPAAPATNQISIQELDDHETYSGAGTGFQFASAPPESTKVIFGYADDQEPSNMRINGKLVALKHVGSKVVKKGKGRQGLGERLVDTWANDAITVEFDYTTTSAGEGGVGYKGKVTVKIGDHSSSFPITGGSGC